jgi:hypothetical protein
MCSCRIVVNFPHTGTQKYMHVKGRVVECGMTGAMLLEQAGSPTADWFVPGEDYLEYSTPAQAKEIVDRLEHCYEETQAIGNRLRAKVLERHNPERFWGRILDRVRLPSVAKVAA